MNLIAKTQQQRDIAESRLNLYIRQGQERAVNLQSRIARDVPVDYIAPAPKMTVQAAGDGLVLRLDRGHDMEPLPLHRYALGQVADQAKLPMAYADHLLEQGAWGRELLARNLTDGLALGHPDAKYLVRSAGGQMRALLSNKFRRIDARPVLNELIGEAQRVGAIVVDGTGSDIRVEMKFIVPKILEPAPGEFMVFGFAWGNSDYGAGANWIRSFAFRLMCFNGATMEQNLRQVHIGRALTEDVEWSERTLRLDTQTAVSAVKDTARALLSEARISATAATITRANEQGIDPAATLAGLKKKVGVGQAKAIAEAFNSPDVVELPAGNTLWRFSNAISLVARNTEAPDQKLDLERLAGDVLKTA
jgi:hypothetical protein